MLLLLAGVRREGRCSSSRGAKLGDEAGFSGVRSASDPEGLMTVWTSTPVLRDAALTRRCRAAMLSSRSLISCATRNVASLPWAATIDALDELQLRKDIERCRGRKTYTYSRQPNATVMGSSLKGFAYAN
jgi:hypothetical protein